MSETTGSSEESWRKERRLWRLVAVVLLLGLTVNQVLDQRRAADANHRADEANRTADELRADLTRVRSEMSDARFQVLQLESKTAGRDVDGRFGELDQRIQRLEAGRKKADGPDKQ